MAKQSPGAAGGCVLQAPPERGLLDRLALWCEGGGRGEATDDLLDLATVLPPQALAPLRPEVVAFYRRPLRFMLRTGVQMGWWSGLLNRVFARIARQSDIPGRGLGPAAYPLCQRLYRDARGRVHWDRYCRVDGRLARLFVARMAGGAGRVEETFVLYGLPVRLSFEPRVDGDALVLELRRLRSSPLAWLARVRYRTAVDEDGVLRTRGEFRVPLVGLHIRTYFEIRRPPQG